MSVSRPNLRPGHPVRLRLAPYAAPTRTQTVRSAVARGLRGLFHVDVVLATLAITLSAVMIVRQLLALFPV